MYGKKLMIEVNVANFITILLIAFVAVFLYKMASSKLGQSQS